LRRRGSVTAIAAAALTLLGATATSAHRLDEYLQAVRIAIDPARVNIELDLTPGIAVAEGIIAAIDRNRDGQLSADEQRAYVDEALRGLTLDLDGRPITLARASSTFPAPETLLGGDGVIRINATTALPPMAAGAHHLRFRNAHRQDVGVYLANALVPATSQVAVTGQRRDAAQSELTIDYVLRAKSPASAPLFFGAAFGMGALAWVLSRPHRAS
jgi:hypothetical protein